MGQKKKCIIRSIMQVIPIFVILVVCLYYFTDNRIIKITGDEYGYWAAGSYIAGLDWSDITSINAYYGYGYGFILAIILKLTSSMITAYQIAIFINICLLCAIYIIALKLVKAFSSSKEIPWYMEIIISFTATVFTSNLVYTQYTLSEAVLAFLYWLLVYLVYLLLQKFTYTRVFLFGFIAVYALSVHMRTVGILAVCLVFLLYIFCKNNIKVMKCLLVFSVIMVLLIVFYIMKSNYQDAWFAKSNGVALAANEMSGQIGKIEYFFSVKGFLSFLTALLGKVFGAFSSTFLVVGVGLAVFLRNICRMIKERGTQGEQYTLFKVDEFFAFLLFSTLFMMGIGSLYMIDFSGRFDLLTYGRYYEFTLSPLILISFLYLYDLEIKTMLKCIVLIIICYMAVALYINHIQDYSLSKESVFVQNIGIASTLMKLEYQGNAFLFLMTRGLAVCVTLLCIVSAESRNMKKLLYSVTMIIISVFWIYSALYNYKNGCLNWAIPMQEAEISLSKYVEKEKIGDKLYYYYSEDVLKADVLQFLLKNDTIHCINDVSDFADKHKKEYLLTPKQTNIERKLYAEGFSIIQETTLLKLWKYD